MSQESKTPVFTAQFRLSLLQRRVLVLDGPSKGHWAHTVSNPDWGDFHYAVRNVHPEKGYLL